MKITAPQRTVLSVFWLALKIALILLLVHDEVPRVLYQNF